MDLLEVGAPDLKARFEAYLGELRTLRSDPHEAFKKAFDGVLLQDRLIAYLQSGRVPMRYFAAPPPSTDEAARKRRIREMPEEQGHLHLAWLGASLRGEDDRERVRLHLAAAKRSPRTRDAAYLVAALALYLKNDLDGAAREVDEGLRGARDSAPLLEARLDILLGREAPLADLQQAAGLLQHVAATGGQFCTLAQVAIMAGDRRAALALSERATQLARRLLGCWPEVIARRMAP